MLDLSSVLMYCNYTCTVYTRCVYVCMYWCVVRTLCVHLQVVRMGHPARLVESVQKLSLDAQLAARDSAGIIRDVKQELEQALVRRQ